MLELFSFLSDVKFQMNFTEIAGHVTEPSREPWKVANFVVHYNQFNVLLIKEVTKLSEKEN